jgi:NhaP-type Na+/H+ or K+/H+ antiporter
VSATVRACRPSPPVSIFLEEPVVVFGVLLMAGALVSGVARRSFLSLTAGFVVAGFLLGQGGLELLDLDPRSDFVQGLAVIALVLILFRDGLEVEQEMLQTAWHLPLRALVLAMPLTAGLIAVVTHVLTDLGWTESFLVGALLSPTDPVLSSSVVTNPRVPRIGTAGLPPEGNGFIAVFVAAIAFGIWRPDIRETFEARSEDLLEVVKLGVFLAFGAIFTLDALFEDGWAAVGIAAFTLLVARPVALFAALAGSRQVGTAAKAFMSWFGPKGVATMTFALFVLGSTAPAAERIAGLAALVVFVSVIVHGLTDQPGAEWMARRAEREPEPAAA